MLILSRREGEAFIIDDHINIAVTSVKGKYVKFRIVAPREVIIYREELYHKIQADKAKEED